MQPGYILLDVDDTIYAQGQGPFALVVERIGAYVEQQLKLDPEPARILRHQYVAAYGSTLGGLMAHHGVDPQEFLDYVHDVPVERLLSRDERLRAALTALPAPLAIFSNGSADYVQRILKALGVEEFFSEFFTIEDFDFIPKPQARPYQTALGRLGLPPERLLLVDDRADNVNAARRHGFQALQLDPQAAGALKSIYELPAALAKLE